MYKSYLAEKNNYSKNTFLSNEEIYSNVNQKHVSRYYLHYQKNVCRDILYKQNIRNLLMIPKIKKIVLNITHKNIITDKKNIIPALASLELIAGQKLKWTSAHNSISAFKIRKKQIIGCKVNLRSTQMFNFLEKLTTIILPRIRNFNAIGINNLNTCGHLSIGLFDILTFPELDNYFEYFANLKGLDISVITNIKISNHLHNSNTNNTLKTLVFLSAFQIPAQQ